MPRKITWNLLTVLLLNACLFLLPGATAVAQQTFQLRLPGSDLQSFARLGTQRLIVNNDGEETVYLCDPRLDSEGFSARSNVELGQSIRWPVTNQGAFQIGNSEGRVGRFRPSQMTIVPKPNVGPDNGFDAGDST